MIWLSHGLSDYFIIHHNISFDETGKLIDYRKSSTDLNDGETYEYSWWITSVDGNIVKYGLDDLVTGKEKPLASLPSSRAKTAVLHEKTADDFLTTMESNKDNDFKLIPAADDVRMDPLVTETYENNALVHLDVYQVYDEDGFGLYTKSYDVTYDQYGNPVGIDEFIKDYYRPQNAYAPEKDSLGRIRSFTNPLNGCRVTYKYLDDQEAH